MATLSFKPKQVTKRLLTALPERAREVIERRYGLSTAAAQPMTLDAIGQIYGITRERVRQIENQALSNMRRSDAYRDATPIFEELREAIDSLGSIISEEDVLEYVAKKEDIQNHINLLLTLGDYFSHEREDAEFRHRWCTDSEIGKQVKAALRTLYKNLESDQLIPESEVINRCLQELQAVNEKYRDEEIIRRWLKLSKQIGSNPLGEWGRAESPNVRVKGIRDYAYLAIKRHGSPMHFSEVAKSITNLFGKEAHVATCHNELIKDPRFVLVGRGLYALAEWGYHQGVVKDVIRGILQDNGPLTRQEIIDRVKKERYVKDNTILVNLQDTRSFIRGRDGKYTLAE